jgi:hypothetical protein
MKKYIIIILAATAALLYNCGEDKMPFYSGNHSVYFLQPETNFSFGLLTVTDSTILLPVTVTGGPVDHDRHFDIVYDSVSGTPGVHFDTLPTRGIIPADSVSGGCRVTLHRVANDNAAYTIRARLVPNDDFRLDVKEKYHRGDTIDVTRFTLNYSSYITKPKIWDDRMFGYFSVAKYLVACDVTGRGAEFWGGKPDGQETMGYAVAIAVYINSKIAAGRDHALRDPDNPNPEDKGFMTMKGASPIFTGTVLAIPGDWAPAR